MIFLKYICLILITSGCTSIGFLLSKKFTNRVIELKTLSNLINTMQNKIKFTQKPLKEVLFEISKLDKKSNISKIFLKTSKKLEKARIEEALSEAIEEEKNMTSLKKEDINILKSLGNGLRKNRHRRTDE